MLINFTVFTWGRIPNMNQIKIATLLLASIASSSFQLQATDNNVTPHHYQRLKFERLSLEEGLSQSIVEGIVQDSQGFMWFCTEDGLNRYDGYNFTVLRSNPEDQASLSQNHTLAILQARDGNLWIGAFNGGLNMYDPSTEKITIFRTNPADPSSLCNDMVRSIYQDSDGFLWIGTDGGLSKLNPQTKKIINFYHDPHQPRSISNNTIRSICADNEGRLWLATDNGLNRYDEEQNIFIRYYNDPVNQNSLSHNQVRKITCSRSGALWIGTDGGGLDKLSFAIGGMPQFTHYIHDETDPASISHNSIYSLFEEDNGILWIGTNGGGLNIFNPNTNSFSHFIYDPLDSQSISYDEIYDIYQDNAGVIWLGTYGGGICKFSKLSQQFAHFKKRLNVANSLNHDIVWSILEDDDGILWIGTHGGGLNRFDRNTNTWTHYLHDPDDPRSIGHNIVRTINMDDQNDLWLGTNGAGISHFDRQTEKFVNYRHDANNPKSISHDHIRCVFRDSNGFFWIGTYGGGLNKFNQETGAFKHYRHDPQNQNSICNDYIRTVIEDKNGFLWIGTQGGGLNKLDPRTDEFTLFINNPDDTTTISNDFIFSIIEQEDGTFWLGTYGGGLNKFNPTTGQCERFTTNHGLASNSIYGVVIDFSNNLWISTSNGMSQFNPHAKIFTNYNIDDGLQSTEFNGGSYFKSASGELFFGGINGFNAFYPDQIRQNEHIPPIVITSFFKFNKKTKLADPIGSTKVLKLSHKDYFFSFEFVALDFASPNQNQYAYKMKGLDKDWIYTNWTKRFAGYTTLPPGKYAFIVKGSNNDGVWNEKGASIKIIIAPPFWKTPWFILIIFCCVVLALYTLYNMRTRSARQKRRELEKSVIEQSEAAEKLETALGEVQRLKNRLQAENTYLQDEIKIVTNFENIITKSPKFHKVLRQVEQVAKTNATVLITGESGTGKELIARAVHKLSDRSERILVKVNCSALPGNLIESEFFGHEKGAFTGAIAKKAGRFELADGGAIFLDEIGDLPLELQAKLLRVLQEGEFERIGGTETLKVNVRVIAATNRNLAKEIQKGAFREDLFFRLNVFPLELPPLRDRKEDIPLLVSYFMKKYIAKIGIKDTKVPQSVIDELLSYNWPGNVRELEHVIERSLITCRSDKLSLGDWLEKTETSQPSKDLTTLSENEKRHILKALYASNWKISGSHGAADILGINAKTLESRMKRLQISRTSETS
jgi:DNA-binding NtrC family response regulator/ligand-binding sensor domain-containing protein